MSSDLMAEVRRRLPPEVDVVTLVSGAVPLSGGGAMPVDATDVAGSKAHVVAVSRALLGRLTAVGSYQRPPRAAWTGCDDLGGHVAYRVSGRVDEAAGSPDRLLDEVRRVLRDTGVELTEVPTSTDAVTWQGEHDAVRVQLTGYAAQPVVLVSLTGSCLGVGAADEDLLAEAPERLDLP